MAKRPTVRVTVTKRAYDTGAVGAATDHGVRLGPARAEALVLSVNERVRSERWTARRQSCP
jgi:hypothetical protein